MHQIKRDVCLHDAPVPPCSQLCFSPQEWISDVRAGSAASCGNHIKSSCSLIAFNTEQGGGGVLGLVSLDNGNEEKHSVSQLHCHADLVTDFDFSPFDDFLLSTCSADEAPWRITETRFRASPGNRMALSSPRPARTRSCGSLTPGLS
ncbi:coronin-7 [Acipenser ruthenus]|uniref:coronin-7 n=1 Tax=Acipenser ruthenus TaxID=7906 RepID=UPI0027422417|nr:coronin-7 [Acipenser ruthenus]XP_058891379.1 coronin-7 [Acipenser ruthenus]